MQVFHVYQDGNQMGPFTRSQLNSMWSQGILNASATYWTEGMDEWTSLSQLLETPAPTGTHNQTTSPARLLNSMRRNLPLLKQRWHQRTPGSRRILITSALLVLVAVSWAVYFAFPVPTPESTSRSDIQPDASAIRMLHDLMLNSGSGSGNRHTSPCGDCSGRGWSQFPGCPACGGSGAIASPTGFSVICNRCGGSGGSSCGRCGGSGRIQTGGF
jgi:hypothetical protein